METAEDPDAGLGALVEALSEMAKPYGYVVGTLSDFSTIALGIRRPGGEWLASMCAVVSPRGFAFPGAETAAEALVSKYGSRPSWDARFFRERGKMLRFPGGSPEELALKAAAGVEAVLYRHWPGSA